MCERCGNAKNIAVLLYAILNIGTALADNFPMLVIFCFLIGVAGSVALNNVAGTISDLFGVCALPIPGIYKMEQH